jgi:hypothetical protein
MNKITLTLAPQHLRPLRHMCKANYESILANTEATQEEKRLAADLYHRVMLLHNAVNAEEIAVNTRLKYDRYIANGKPFSVHTRAAQPPVMDEPTDNTTTDEKPLEQPPEPPQFIEEGRLVCLENPPTASIAKLKKRSV